MRDLGPLVAALDAPRVHGSLPAAITGMTADSRDVRPGYLFVAMDGQRHNGHAFIGEAIAAGAVAVVVEELPTIGVPAIVVASTQRALSQLAAAYYDRPSDDLEIVGITGTNGKTTTAHFVRAVMEAAGIPCGMIGTLGGWFGDHHWPLINTTPLALELHALLAAMRAAGARGVAMEVSSHALDLGRVDDVRFAAAVFTNLTRDHLDFHGTMERYEQAKARLFELAPQAVINLDDPAGVRLAARYPAAITYAIDAPARVRANDVTIAGDGSTFTVDGEVVTIALPGRFNVGNALAAFGAGRALGIDPAAIRRGLASTRAVPGRMERIGALGINAIVDYAHTPDALDNVLRAAREATHGSLTVVFGCGGDRDPGKRATMGTIAARNADRVIVTSDNPRSEDPLAIANAVAAGIDAEIILDRRSAIRAAIDRARAGDTVVVAGKGHETYQIVGNETRAFDDRDEVRAAFADLAKRTRT